MQSNVSTWYFNFFQGPRGTVICSLLGNHSSCSYWGEGALGLLFWEQSNAVWILIKFIKQITQRLGEAGVHLPALQTDLCRDASWMVVKAKLPSSADGLLSPVGEIWWRSNNSFPLQVFVPCNCDWRSPSLPFPSLVPLPHPPLFIWAMFKSEWFVGETSPGWSHFVYVL